MFPRKLNFGTTNIPPQDSSSESSDNLSTNLATFYVWNQTEGKRGSQEISACLLKHLKTLPSSVRHVVIYSDTCTGQNRNIKVALSLLKLVAQHPTIDRIEQKFLVSGHSFLPNDSDFGSVELAAKKKIIFVPEDWYKIMKECRRNKSFSVVHMKRDEFLSTVPLEQGVVKRKTDTNGRNINWLHIQRLMYKKSHPFSIFFSETSNPAIAYDELNMQVKRGRPRKSH